MRLWAKKCALGCFLHRQLKPGIQVLEQQKEVLGRTLQTMPLEQRFAQTLPGTRVFAGMA